MIGYDSLRLATAALALVALTGCSAGYRNHGYMPPPETLEEITVGVDTRASVEETVGVPSTSGILDDSGFYYVRTRVRSFAYTAPKVVEREILAISFDQAGVVQNIERFGLEEGRVIALERRVTDPDSNRGAFLRSLLSSFGRLAPPNLGG